MIADGDIDYTIADSTEFAIAHDEHPDLRIAFDFPGSQSLAWATSTHDPEFLRDVSWYFSRMQSDGELAAIVNRYYGRAEDAEFAGVVDALARQLAGAPTQGLARTKQAIYESWGRSLEEQLDAERDAQRELGRTADYAEGVAAFSAKRTPQFTGK